MRQGKRMVLFPLLLLGTIVVIWPAFLAGCARSQSQPKPEPAPILVALKSDPESRATEPSANRGFGYIPIGAQSLSVSDHASTVLSALKEFELKNPNILITYWTVDAKHFSASDGYIYGIWISYSKVSK